MTRFLKKKNAFEDPEKQLIRLISKLIKLPKSEHKALFIKTRKYMMDYLATIEESKKEFLVYFNYIGWIDSQINGMPFKQFFFRHTGVIDFE